MPQASGSALTAPGHRTISYNSARTSLLPGASVPREAPSREEMIAGLLQAERAAWLALNSAARLERHRDGWLERERQAIADAEAATNLALAGQPDDDKLDAKLLVGLRAAVRFWRRTGHLEVPQNYPEYLEGKKSSLGVWLAQIRPAKSEQAKRGTKTDPRWARQPLNVLGMRWVAGATGVAPGGLADLPDLVRAADNARLVGNDIDLRINSRGIDEVLERIRQLDLAKAIPSVEERDTLLAAFGRWRDNGTLYPRPGDPADVPLDQWLEKIRLGLASPPFWQLAVLGALGLDWDARRPPRPSVPATDPSIDNSIARGPETPQVPLIAVPVPPAGRLPGESAEAGTRAAELVALEAGWRRRQERDRARVAARVRIYDQLRSRLGITELNVPGDGNCFYASLQIMFEPRLREFFRRVPGIGGRMPTIDEMRDSLADALQADFAQVNAGQQAQARYAQWFPGTTTGPADLQHAAQQAVLRDIRPDPTADPRWNNEAGDRVAEVAARLWGLPITLLGQRYPRDIGPEGTDRRYVIYTGDHYMGAVATQDRVLSANELLTTAGEQARAELAEEAPADERTLARDRAMVTEEFAVLAARFTALTNRSAAMLWSWYGHNGLSTIEAFRDRARYELSQDTVDRLGILYATLRDDYLGELQRLGRQADAYLAGSQLPAGVFAQQARDELIAVLAEASRPHHQDSPYWAALLARGLALLPAADSAYGYTADLPGVDPAYLDVADPIYVAGQAHANTQPGSVPPGDTLFIIRYPQALDISALAGGDPGPIMFAPGARFSVIDDWSGGPRVITLAHLTFYQEPAGGDAQQYDARGTGPAGPAARPGARFPARSWRRARISWPAPAWFPPARPCRDRVHPRR